MGLVILQTILTCIEVLNRQSDECNTSNLKNKKIRVLPTAVKPINYLPVTIAHP